MLISLILALPYSVLVVTYPDSFMHTTEVLYIAAHHPQYMQSQMYFKLQLCSLQTPHTLYLLHKTHFILIALSMQRTFPPNENAISRKLSIEEISTNWKTIHQHKLKPLNQFMRKLKGSRLPVMAKGQHTSRHFSDLKFN